MTKKGSLKSAFVAFPSCPKELSNTILSGINSVEAWGGAKTHFQPWPAMDVFGKCISDEIRSSISEANVLIADITFENQNVYYEVGYAIGQGVPIAPILNRTFDRAVSGVAKDGIFDVIGYEGYQNCIELDGKLRDLPSTKLKSLYSRSLNQSQPMYVLDSFIKSDFRNTIFSSVKDSKIFFRSFDPVETSRMSGTKAIEEITSSSGVIIPFLNHQHEDSSRHNLRAAFMAGLSHGAKKATLLIQRNDGPIPADFRDEVAVVEDEMQLRELVGEFSERALREMQSVEAFKPRMSFGLGALTLGQSAAENEFRNLGNYFFETSEFLKACRGEVRIVAGRKGSGKTAIFFQVRDRVRSDRSAMVIDLKPESHQLSLFREELLNVADRGLFDHTIAGFWNFVLLSEIVLAYRKQLEWQSKFDANALGKVSRIDAELDSNLLLQSGDFTARLNALGREMTEEIRAISARKEKLTPERITNLVYEIGVAKVRGLITELSSGTDRIVFLFDNIDKGWNANRVDDFDIRLVRLLIEGLEKLRHDMAKIGIDFVSTVFLRN